MKKAIFIIDPQNDFCVTPQVATSLGLPNHGTLSVDGAWEDMKRLADFIKSPNVDNIYVTQDTHHVIDISHPSYWMDGQRNRPAPFTLITSKDVENGTWIPVYYMKQTLDYLKALENQGEYPHLIWPEHCINGSWGAAIVDPLMDAIKTFCRENGKVHTVIQKGEIPFTEHFGALRANIPDPKYPTTGINTTLINSLMSHDVVYLAGEARSHCVANTLKQVMQEAPALLPKITVLYDCMSDVFNNGQPWDFAEKIYEDAKNSNVKFIKSTEV